MQMTKRARQTPRSLIRAQRRRINSAVCYLAYELRLGVDTRGIIRFPGQSADHGWYQPFGWRELGQCLYKRALGEDEVFLDAGCGKGRVVIQAARMHPFKRVIGFDLSPELIDIARRNIDTCRHRLRCSDAEVLVADASRWPVPDEVTLVFLYNAFFGDVLERFVDSVVASYDRRPRRLQLLYVGGRGWEYTTVERTGRFKLSYAHGSGEVAPLARMYEVIPPQGDLERSSYAA
jgi:SAM-dependent methyltransferase